MPKLKTSSDLKTFAKNCSAAEKAFGQPLPCAAAQAARLPGPGTLLMPFRRSGQKRARKERQVRTTGCHGFCEQGPIMVIEPGNILYCHVKPEDVAGDRRQDRHGGRGDRTPALYRSGLRAKDSAPKRTCPSTGRRTASFWPRTG